MGTQLNAQEYDIISYNEDDPMDIVNLVIVQPTFKESIKNMKKDITPSKKDEINFQPLRITQLNNRRDKLNMSL